MPVQDVRVIKNQHQAQLGPLPPGPAGRGGFALDYFMILAQSVGQDPSLIKPARRLAQLQDGVLFCGFAVGDEV